MRAPRLGTDMRLSFLVLAFLSGAPARSRHCGTSFNDQIIIYLAADRDDIKWHKSLSALFSRNGLPAAPQILRVLMFVPRHPSRGR